MSIRGMRNKFICGVERRGRDTHIWSSIVLRSFARPSI